MNSFYISPDWEYGIHIGFRVIFIVSCLLNLICFVCLIKKTPQHQSTFRNYLIFIQMLLMLNDISIDVLFEPIPLFPAYAGYCVGFLCKFGVPLQYSLATAILLLANVGVSIVVCCLYRHQTVLFSNSIFKLRRRTLAIIRAFLFITFSIPGLILYIPLDSSKSDQLIAKFSPDISWIKTRGTYIMYERTVAIVAIFALLLGVVVGAMISVIAMLAHVVYTLKIQYRNSPSSLKRHRKSLQVFFIQIGIPILLLIIPGKIMLIGLIFECIPFEVCLVAYFTLPLHPIGHNVILLAVTPAYRNYIGHLIRGGACGMYATFTSKTNQAGKRISAIRVNPLHSDFNCQNQDKVE